MALPRRTGRSRLTLALLILTSLAVLTLDFRNASIVESARRAAATVFSPLRGVADAVTSPFSNGWDGIRHYGDVQSENDRLRRRIAELEGQQAEAANALAENEQLHKEADIPWLGDVQRVEARVVSGAVSNFSHSIDISKGSKDGIAVGMPVVSGDGLVGRVQLVTSERSTVQLITDPDFRVGVKVQPGGVLGTARGTGKGEPLEVDTGLAADTSVEPGGAVTTSGEEKSVFPASIPIGTVEGSSKAAGGLTLNLRVQPLIDTERLTFVTVLLRQDPG